MGGPAEVQAQALEYGLIPAEVAQAAHGTASYFGGIATAGKNMPAATAAAALLSRGAHNAKKRAHFVKNPDAAMLEPEKPLAECMWPRNIQTY